MAQLDLYIKSKLKKIALNSKRSSSQQFTTLLLVGVDKTESISVDTRLIKSLKPIVAISAITLIMCVAIIFILISLSIKKSIEVEQARKAETKALQAKQELQVTVKELEKRTYKEVQQKLGTLEATGETVNELQQYLQERGIKLPETAPNEGSKKVEGLNNRIESSSNSIEYSNNQTNDETVQTTDMTNVLKNHQGGPGPVTVDISHIQQYELKIKGLNDIARNVPIGLPHNGALSSRFGKRSNPFAGRLSEFHHGLDFRGKTGQPIKTTADGVVVTAGRLGGYGLVVKVKHGYGYLTVYGHLSKVDVTVGQQVEAGDVIGKLGSTGRSTGPHLHYEIRQSGQLLDPENFISLTASTH